MLEPVGIQLGWVALSALPKIRETLLLRLILMRGPVYEQALEELDRLPDDAWEKSIANQFVLVKRQKLIEDQQSGRRELSKEEEEFVMSIEQRYALIEKQMMEKGREKGRQEGRQEALHEVLVQIYKSRFGKVPVKIVKALKQEHAAERLLSWSAAFSTQSPKEIAHALGLNGG